jgi:hypothetical protein
VDWADTNSAEWIVEEDGVILGDREHVSAIALKKIVKEALMEEQAPSGLDEEMVDAVWNLQVQ